MVEALRAGWTRGHGERGRISPKVQAAIETRLAQLSEPARELVGVAATIGRAFTTDVLADAGEADEDALVRGLDELWRRRIVREQGADAYDFSHDKIREVAYLALSPARRRHHHLRVARALERLHGRRPGTGQRPARRTLRARRRDRPGDRPGTSGRRRRPSSCTPTSRRSASWTARSTCSARCRRPPSAGRGNSRILAALPAPLGVVEGWASPRLPTSSSARSSSRVALGVEPAPPLLRSLAVASLSRGDFAGARRFGERLRARGERDADDVLLVEGDYVLGIAAFWQGEFAAARGHFEAAVDRYRPEHRRAHLLQYGLDPKVVCLSRLGNTLWFLGCPAAAIRARDAALALADEIGHPFSQAIALVFAALLALDLREPERVRARRGTRLIAAGGPCGTADPVSAEAIAGYVDVVDGRTAAASPASSGRWTRRAGPTTRPACRPASAALLLEACAVAGDARTGLAAAESALGDGARPLGGGGAPAARRVPRGARRARRTRSRRSSNGRSTSRAARARGARGAGRDQPAPPAAARGDGDGA